MATIHVFRHAEAMHNRYRELRQTRDPDLSPEGRQQCLELLVSFPHMDKVKYLVSSPMRRAINSCLLAFSPVVLKEPVVLVPQLTEAGSQVSSFGSSPSELHEEFGKKISLGLVPENWNAVSPDSPSAYDLEKIEDRTTRARLLLISAAREAGDGSHIVVMTHGQTAHFMTDDFSGVEPPKFRCDWGGNLDYRSYKFDFDSGTMIETPDSRQKRGLPAVVTADELTKNDEARDSLCSRIVERTPQVHELYEKYNSSLN
ncbi:hypothetical protein AAE478_005342 [Parahypoxylon ruwenzoriense]